VAATALALALGVLDAAAASAGTATPASLQTAINVTPGTGADGDLAVSRVLGTGARFIRLGVGWRNVAPASRAPGFDPSNPDSPGYNWGEVDREVALVTSRGLTPILNILGAPDWAESSPSTDGALNPDPAELGRFALAAARRYDGSRPGLPRVRYWSVWNEPNWSIFVHPQIVNGRDVSVDRYRDMVNAFAAAAHSVLADNVVIAGELFPVGTVRGNLRAIAPMRFARELFCLSAGAHPHRTCSSKLSADVISVHPYTSGGPSTLPADPDNVWIATLPSFTTLVRQAQAQGTLVSQGRVATWVTEFAWTTNPPRGGGVAVRYAQGWVAEALYRAWRAGISLFTWFSLRDDPLGVSGYQTGLYYACATGSSCDTPKPLLRAFRFPFVALRQSGRVVNTWGRVPPGEEGSVRLQWLRGRRWQTFATARTTSGGIFARRLRLPAGADPRSAVLRAQTVALAESSSPFSLNPPPDFPVKPFV
jgi:hypothetical protein